MLWVGRNVLKLIKIIYFLVKIFIMINTYYFYIATIKVFNEKRNVLTCSDYEFCKKFILRYIILVFNKMKFCILIKLELADFAVNTI